MARAALRIRGLQVLRGIAACAVVYSHAYRRAERSWAADIGSSLVDPIRPVTQLGHFGVDLFFILSGFLMMHLHRDAFGASGAPIEFLRRRLKRIVPLYWFLSALGLALLWLAPALFTYHTEIEWRWVLGCFAFVPWPMADGFSEPIIGAGWTLEYEMYFYVLFTLALIFSEGFIALCSVLLGSVLLGLLLDPHHPWLKLLTGPLLIEFLFGMLVALTVHRLPRRWVPALMTLAISAIALGEHNPIRAPGTDPRVVLGHTVRRAVGVHGHPWI